MTINQEGTKSDVVSAPTAPTIHYIDRPDCNEIFADSIKSMYFDGQSLRIEFTVTRLDEAVKPAISGRCYPVQRMALTPSAAVDLINRVQQVATALKQAGVLKAANDAR